MELKFIIKILYYLKRQKMNKMKSSNLNLNIFESKGWFFIEI